MKKVIVLCALFMGILASAQQIERIEPPNWWVGMQHQKLEILVYGQDIGKLNPQIEGNEVALLKITKAPNKNYIFLNLDLSNASPGSFKVSFTNDNGRIISAFDYELKERLPHSRERKGFDSSDAIYLITPDRFANADESNDSVDGMNEQGINRSHDYARHGGDLQGITSNLDYIDSMGFTAIWPCPVLTNDMKRSSYHGYAMTDFYEVDPRYGTLEDYKKLSSEAKSKGIKLIMDQVANHVGLEHWWMKDLPFSDWVNYQKVFEKNEKTIYSNHRRTINQDRYASKIDAYGMTNGWFVDAMPDLNQKNPYMARYLIQNSIWWVETLDLGGIRQDTYPYPDKKFMAHWTKAIMKEYPNFSIVGEEWSLNPLLVAYWQKGHKNSDGYKSYLTSTMDFPMQRFIVEALNEDERWDKGFVKMYEGLANDFVYKSPKDIMIFPDNHDMSRIYTQLGEDLVKTQMAVGYMVTMPRIVQVYYGTEILMNDTAKPGDHGLIRTDFPGGWKGDAVNAFTGQGLTPDQRDMQDFVRKVLNYRKHSKAIHKGKTVHFAPENGVYTLFRKHKDETVVVILNKNTETVSIDLDRYKEMQLQGKTLKNIVDGTSVDWTDAMVLERPGIIMLTTKM